MKETDRISIVTNVCLQDGPRILHSVPSWLRSFGERIGEILITVDDQQPSGRIRDLHQEFGTKAELISIVDALCQIDKRVRGVPLPCRQEIKTVSRMWFTRGNPIRCQQGTPIAAYVFAIISARYDIQLKCDCDMLFYNSNWLESSLERLSQGQLHMLEPPRIGDSSYESKTVSTRALMLNRRKLHEILPMKAYMLDPLRIVHRKLQGRSPYLAFEQMLEVAKRKKILNHEFMTSGGFSLHLAKRSDVMQPGFGTVVERVERGIFPPSQKLSGWDYDPELWLTAEEEQGRFQS